MARLVTVAKREKREMRNKGALWQGASEANTDAGGRWRGIRPEAAHCGSVTTAPARKHNATKVVRLKTKFLKSQGKRSKTAVLTKTRARVFEKNKKLQN